MLPDDRLRIALFDLSDLELKFSANRMSVLGCWVRKGITPEYKVFWLPYLRIAFDSWMEDPIQYLNLKL